METGRMLRGKTAIVTGSTSGIGLSIAHGLAQAGTNIVLNGFGEPEAIGRVIDDLSRQHNVGVIYSSADISKPDEIATMVAAAGQQFGMVDILVNNAGIQYVAPIEDFPIEKWNAIIAINLSGAFHACRLVIPNMKKNRWGRIINVASAHALVASPFKVAYVAAKHGIAGLTKTIALELAEYGVTVNAICPGYVRTPLVEKQIPEQAKARGITEEAVVKDVLLAAQPTKRFVEVSEVSSLATFLCSHEAASVTGTVLPVDGGWTAH
jgi:3-hydroxybutyrate dehydrogenase